MTTVTCLRQNSEALERLVEQRARDLERRCTKLAISPREARIVVMWGGGKDSTLALIVTAAVAELTGCSVRAVTMLHPGLTGGTLKNIETIKRELGLEHEWRQFLRVLPSCDNPNFEDWMVIYRRLAFATAFHPRFMCVACNFGAVVTEYEAMKDAGAHFRVTGNPPAELSMFELWATGLRSQFDRHISFLDNTGHVLVDYYRLWWAVYKELLDELRYLRIPHANIREDDPGDMVSKYLYTTPTRESPLGCADVFAILGDTGPTCDPLETQKLLRGFGWHLPDDIQGGTESDCAMPSAITVVDIAHNGVAEHLVHLKHAASVLKPLPEMYERAVDWAKSGKSSEVGNTLLSRMGLSLDCLLKVGEFPHAPVARTLVGQLLPVR